MHVDYLKRWNPRLEIRRGKRVDFRTLGFVNYESERLLTYAVTEEEMACAQDNTDVAVLLVCRRSADRGATRASHVVCDDPARVFFELHNHLAEATRFYGVHAPSRIHRSARIHPRAHVDGVGVTVGPGAVVEAGAVILAGATLERGVRVGPGSAVGTQGLQQRTFGKKRIRLVHKGGAYLGAQAVIGANAVIDASLFNQPTYIGRNAFVGDGALVSHQVAVGERATILSGAILLGTSFVEDEAVVGPGVILSNDVTVGRRGVVTAGSFVIRDVPAGSKATGYFALEHRDFLYAFARFRGRR